jgi:murein DD-endopeptidase MepM/ murein hydrolase activator NlpD
MRTFYEHSSAKFLSISIKGGSKYYAHALWALDYALLTQAAGRTNANFIETPPIYVNKAPTVANPAILRLNESWWKSVRDTQRVIYCRVDWAGKLAQPWVLLEEFEFIINHAPIANAGKDEIIALDPMGNLLADIRLDASGSDDFDLHGPQHVAGPLSYRWSPVQTPITLAAGSAVHNAAYGLANTVNPVFLSAGTAIPASDRGAYVFRLTVDDGEVATLGLRSGQSRTNTSDARIMLDAQAGPNLTLLSPTTQNPFLGNFEDGVDIPIYYMLGLPLTQQNAYQNGWRLRCTITQAIQSPKFPSNAAGTRVFEVITIPRPGQAEIIRWDGLETSTPTPGWKAIGAFDIKLELLDINGNLPPGIAGNVILESRAIVLDYARWLFPVEFATLQAVLSGTFGESNHLGDLGTRLHTGLDISAVGPPNLQAARSGYYGLSNVHIIELTHAMPERTRYLHGTNLQAYIQGALVLQGARLATMSDVGVPGSVHLHFEYRIRKPTDPGPTAINPLTIVPVRDVLAPEPIEAVIIRAASAVGLPADLANPSNGINAMADLIIRCRDRADPNHNTAIDNSPYRVWVVEQNPVANWPEIRFDAIDSTKHLRDFYARQADYLQFGFPRTSDNHYLLYLRWDTTGYQRRHSPLRFTVNIADFMGSTTRRDIVFGPDAVYVSGPPDPATTSAQPKTFEVDVAITNWTNGLDGVNFDDYHLELAGAPVGWTIARKGAAAGTGLRTGPINNGATRQMILIVDPNAVAPVGTHTFEIIVSSDILRQVGSRVTITARVV